MCNIWSFKILVMVFNVIFDSENLFIHNIFYILSKTYLLKNNVRTKVNAFNNLFTN